MEASPVAWLTADETRELTTDSALDTAEDTWDLAVLIAPPAPELACDTAEEIRELITDSTLDTADGALETAEDS